MKRIGVLLIAVVLIVGMVGCEPTPTTQYDLTIASTEGGNVTTPGEGTFAYDEGTVVNLTAEAEESYYFVNWTGDTATIANVNNPATTIIMQNDYSINANFEQIPPGQSVLAISSTAGGSVTAPGEGVFIYDEGTVVNLVATPEASCHFVSWTGNVSTIGNIYAASTNITVNGNYLITANFVAVHNLTISSTTGGNVSIPGEGTFTYEDGTVVGLNATPDAGYHFVRWTGNVSTIGNIYAASTNITVSSDCSVTANFARYTPMVAAGGYFTVGVKADGTVVAAGENTYGQCNVGDWSDIISVAGGTYHTVGVKSDGTLVAVGRNSLQQCDVDGWTDAIQVAAGNGHSVWVKSDGTVVAVGAYGEGQCDVGAWTGITQVAAGGWHTVGLKSDGTVVAVGQNNWGECNVGNWTDIIQVAAGFSYTVGVKSDGTVVAVGRNEHGQCNVSSWVGIVQIATGVRHTVGLKADGTVVAVGDNGEGQCLVLGFNGIIQVAAGHYHTVGLKSNGSVDAVGYNNYGQCDVSGWDLN